MASRDALDARFVTDAEPPRELPLLVGRGKGESEALLLIGRVEREQVAVRRWSADDWSATPASTTEGAATLLAWIEAQAAGGRTLNQSLYGIRRWLLGDAPASPTG